MRRLLLFVLSFLLFLPLLFNVDINRQLAYDKKEKFDARLHRLNSIPLLEQYTDSIAAAKNIAANSFEYTELLESVIESRFYHGFSHFSLSENWIAAAAGKFLKEDYACKVQPELILQHEHAACSQQVLVMMTVLRNKKLNYRSVGFPHHYAIEVLINNEWYFFDPNMEPGISKEKRMLSVWNHNNDLLKNCYDPQRFAYLDYQFGINVSAKNGPVNEVPAQNARVFQAVTGFLSKVAWCMPLLLVLYRSKLKSTVLPRSAVSKKKQPAFGLST